MSDDLVWLSLPTRLTAEDWESPKLWCPFSTPTGGKSTPPPPSIAAWFITTPCTASRHDPVLPAGRILDGSPRDGGLYKFRDRGPGAFGALIAKKDRL